MTTPPIETGSSTETESPQDRAKVAAGRLAARRYCFDGARLGLGSGTTSHHFVRALGELVRDGLRVVGVPTSTGTRDLAAELGIPLVALDDVHELDVCIDGADEIDPAGVLIKGGGGCLLWEKLVARASQRMVVIADSAKPVPVLGAFPLPIEVAQFSWGTTARAVGRLLAGQGYSAEVPIIRREDAGTPFITDNGNFILDIALGEVRDAAELALRLNQIPGVVENGFFIGIAAEAVFGWPDGTASAFSFPLELPLDAGSGEAG